MGNETMDESATTLDDLRTLTVSETANVLGVSQETVRRYVQAGRLAAMRWGRRLRITREAVRQFQRSCVVPVPDRAAEVRQQLRRLKSGGRS